MVLYGITLVPLTEDLRDEDPNILSPFYADDETLDGLVRRNAAQLILLMEWGPDRGYFSDPEKSLFIADNPEDEETARQEFDWVGLNLNYVGGSRYLRAYLGPRE